MILPRGKHKAPNVTLPAVWRAVSPDFQHGRPPTYFAYPSTTEEVEYFRALSQSKLGNKTAAEAIWQKLARNEFSYYGQRAAEKLRRLTLENATSSCLSGGEMMLKNVDSDLTSLGHAVRTEMDPSADIGFTETKKYVLSVFAARAAYRSLAKYGEIANGH